MITLKANRRHIIDRMMDCDQMCFLFLNIIINQTQPAFTCSKLTIETLEQGVKYVQS